MIQISACLGLEGISELRMSQKQGFANHNRSVVWSLLMIFYHIVAPNPRNVLELERGRPDRQIRKSRTDSGRTICGPPVVRTTRCADSWILDFIAL